MRAYVIEILRTGIARDGTFDSTRSSSQEAMHPARDKFFEPVALAEAGPQLGMSEIVLCDPQDSRVSLSMRCCTMPGQKADLPAWEAIARARAAR